MKHVQSISIPPLISPSQYFVKSKMIKYLIIYIFLWQSYYFLSVGFKYSPLYPILLWKATAILHASVSWVWTHKANIHTFSEGTEENHEKTSQNSSSLVEDFNQGVMKHQHQCSLAAQSSGITLNDPVGIYISEHGL